MKFVRCTIPYLMHLFHLPHKRTLAKNYSLNSRNPRYMPTEEGCWIFSNDFFPLSAQCFIPIALRDCRCQISISIGFDQHQGDCLYQSGVRGPVQSDSQPFFEAVLSVPGFSFDFVRGGTNWYSQPKYVERIAVVWFLLLRDRILLFQDLYSHYFVCKNCVELTGFVWTPASINGGADVSFINVYPPISNKFALLLGFFCHSQMCDTTHHRPRKSAYYSHTYSSF